LLPGSMRLCMVFGTGSAVTWPPKRGTFCTRIIVCVHRAKKPIVFSTPRHCVSYGG
jgi:hypothetical protein